MTNFSVNDKKNSISQQFFYPTLSIYDIDWPQQNLLITWKSGAIFFKYDRKCQALRANAAACGYRLSVNIYRKGLNFRQSQMWLFGDRFLENFSLFKNDFAKSEIES